MEQAIDSESGVKTPQQQHLEKFHWKPGVSGNLKGRPQGSRNKLGEIFIAAMHSDFMEHGASVIEEVRTNYPAQYLKVIAAIIPKELQVRDASFDELSDDELHSLVTEMRSFRAKIIEGRAVKSGEEQSDSVHGSDVPAVQDSELPSSNSGAT